MPCHTEMLASPEVIGGSYIIPRLLRDGFMPVGKPLASSDPLYRRSYDSASVLICKIVVSPTTSLSCA